MTQFTYAGKTYVGFDLSSAELPADVIAAGRQAAAQELADTHILSHYPTAAQLSILRAGTDEEKAELTAFIDACRTWSNGENPDPTALAEIKP